MLDKFTRHPRVFDRPGLNFDFGEEKWGVLFLNMGGPETADDTGEYLYNVFSDRNIIKLPLSFLLQKPLAKFIASRRTPMVKNRYQAIGGGSPLLKWSRLAASGVKRELAKQYPQVEVFAGMRYFEPYIHEELEAAVGEGCHHIVILPMYPQYCLATTGTALAATLDWIEESKTEMTFSVIGHWYERTKYIDLLRKRIDEAIEKLDDKNAKIIFSAHAIPQKLVESGDPYYGQIKENAALAGEGYDYILTFQSRSGPVKWVGPDTLQTVQSLGREGLKELVVMPLSFVSDHIETLYEIDIQLQEAAGQVGIKKMVRTESLNDDPRFTEFLADLIEEKIKGE